MFIIALLLLESNGYINFNGSSGLLFYIIMFLIDASLIDAIADRIRK